MRLVRCTLFLLAASALAQEPKEERVAWNGVELRYWRSTAASAKAAPLLVVLPGGGADQQFLHNMFNEWRQLAASRGWHLLLPLLPTGSDTGAKALDLIVADAARRLAVDRGRVYLAGAGVSASDVFYDVSRIPDLWAAAVAIQGNPATAIHSSKLYGANTAEAPLLWVAPPPGFEPLQQKLKAAQFHFEIRDGAKAADVLDWLASHHREEFPLNIDCETGNSALARCYWIEMKKFDPRRRNDVLASTRVNPGSGAYLDLGGFGFTPSAEGPGVLVEWLPEGYQGPLKLNDRILSVGGKPMRDGREYSRFIEQQTDEKPVAIVVQRGREHVRIETKIALPKRDEAVTARVQGQYLPDQKEVLIISRAVVELRLTIPPQWAPVQVSWNGLDVMKEAGAGCWVLSIEKDPPTAAPCP